MSSWEQRRSCHWITSVGSCCPWTPPPPLPKFFCSFSFFFFLLLRSSGNKLCTSPHTLCGVTRGITLLLLSVVELFVLILSLSLSHPPSYFSHFFLHILSCLARCPSVFSVLTFFTSLCLCGFLSFFLSGVQMHLLVIAVKPTLWPVSTVCRLPLLSLVSDCPCVVLHAGCIDCFHILLWPDLYTSVSSDDSLASWRRLAESVSVYSQHVLSFGLLCN